MSKCTHSQAFLHTSSYPDALLWRQRHLNNIDQSHVISDIVCPFIHLKAFWFIDHYVQNDILLNVQFANFLFAWTTWLQSERKISNYYWDFLQYKHRANSKVMHNTRKQEPKFRPWKDRYLPSVYRYNISPRKILTYYDILIASILFT